MKSLRMIGLALAAMAAFMAFAAVASATTLTSPEGTTYTGEIAAEAEGHAVLTGSFGVKVECASNVSGTITDHGEGKEVKGTIEALSFTGCTDGYAAHVKKTGTLSINSSGTVSGQNNEVQVTTPLGINCTYNTGAGGTKLGTLTDSSETGGTATMDIEATIPRTGGSFLCGSSGVWEGSYIVTTPDSLYVD